MQVKKQELELDMEQQTGTKSRKGVSYYQLLQEIILFWEMEKRGISDMSLSICS